MQPCLCVHQQVTISHFFQIIIRTDHLLPNMPAPASATSSVSPKPLSLELCHWARKGLQGVLHPSSGESASGFCAGNGSELSIRQNPSNLDQSVEIQKFRNAGEPNPSHEATPVSTTPRTAITGIQRPLEQSCASI